MQVKISPSSSYLLVEQTSVQLAMEGGSIAGREEFQGHKSLKQGRDVLLDGLQRGMLLLFGMSQSKSKH